MTTLEKIRAEILDYFLWEGQSVDNLPLYVRRVLNIIDKYAEQEPTDKSNLEKICEELAAENDDLRDQLAMRDRFQKQEPTSPCDLCRFNPPSSADGKPCTMCPAEKGGKE